MLPQSDSLLWSISGRSCSSGRLVEPFQAPGSRVQAPLENPLFPDTKSDIFSTNFLLPFTIQPLKSIIRNGPLTAGPFFFDYADPMLPVRSSGAYRFGWIAINQPPLWRSYPGTGQSHLNLWVRRQPSFRPSLRRSCVGRNPGNLAVGTSAFPGNVWIPAYAGMTGKMRLP